MAELIDRKLLLEKIEEMPFIHDRYDHEHGDITFINGVETGYELIKGIIEDQPKVREWIPVEERLPETEEEVFVLTARGTRTTAIYEDGTMREDDSMWHWYNIGGEWEWDEEKDCYIIPKGWWEYRHFNPDDVYNNAIDEVVVAWMPLPEPYKGGV